MPVKPDRAPLADRSAGGGMALLVIDMISTWDFDGAEKIVAAATAIAPRIGALKRRCVRAGVPVIYVNDNRGRWRSEFRELVRISIEESKTGAAIARHLQPEDDDYSVLKPKHSAFYATPLDLLLRHLRVNRLLITGVASDQCIVMSAAEAKMRDYEVVVPRDCIASLSAERDRRLLDYLSEVTQVETPVGSEVELPARR